MLSLWFLLAMSSSICTSSAFVVLPSTTPRIRQDTTHLSAIASMVKKAKQASLRQFVADGGLTDDLKAIYSDMMQKIADDADSTTASTQTPRTVFDAVTRRRGTLSVVAEYTRKTRFGRTSDLYDPEIMSPLFREYGAAAIAVTCDPVSGGCGVDTLAEIATEQRRAHAEVPGPVAVLNHDVLVDELQIAQSRLYHADGVILSAALFRDDPDALRALVRASMAVDLEVLMAVTPDSTAVGRAALDQAGYPADTRMLVLQGVDETADRLAWRAALEDDTTTNPMTTVCHTGPARDWNSLPEIEDAWALRDGGFQAVMIGEALYKSGSLEVEHPGVILQSLKSKSSLQFASPRVRNGRGEGAREYLGDILM